MSTNSKYLSFLDCAIGFYKQGLDMIEPENDEFTILSGCLLLVTGLEKLLKHALEAASPLLTLEDISLDDVIELHSGKQFDRKKVLTLRRAFDRLTLIHKSLDQERMHVAAIAQERNFLVHEAGHYTVGKLENGIRFYLSTITESVCSKSLGKSPEDVVGKELWERLSSYRQAHKIEIDKRVAWFKRLYSQKQKLPCEPVDILPGAVVYDYECPICDVDAQLEIDVDIDAEAGQWPYGSKFKCGNCGFTLSEPDEIHELLGDNNIRELFYDPSDYYE